MAELKSCPFCKGQNINIIACYDDACAIGFCEGCDKVRYTVVCNARRGGCGAICGWKATKEEAIKAWNTRTPKERGADKPKITCLNCKHLMFSDMYGECNKQLKIVNPSDTCEFAEPKERGWEK